MRKSRRKVLSRIIEWVAASLALVDVVFYLAVLRPLRRVVAAEAQARDLARSHILEERSRVELWKKRLAAVPGADKEMQGFLRDHVPARRRGYSHAARLVRRLAQESSLQLSTVSYKPDSAAAEPLEPLGIDVTVEGSFPGLLKFAHALESGNDFIVVRGFAFQPGEGGNLALRLAADLYLEP